MYVFVWVSMCMLSVIIETTDVDPVMVWRSESMEYGYLEELAVRTVHSELMWANSMIVSSVTLSLKMKVSDVNIVPLYRCICEFQSANDLYDEWVCDAIVCVGTPPLIS